MSPAIIRPSVRQHSIKVQICTPATAAELSNNSLADAALDPDAIAEIRARSSMVMAYEKLPDTIKQRIDGLYAKHSVEHMFGASCRSKNVTHWPRRTPPLSTRLCSPIPRREKRCCSSTRRSRPHFSNFSNFEYIRYGQDFMPEAHHLMNYLTSQAAIPEFQVRLKWRTNTVAMWDNLRVQHCAVADYGYAPKKDAARHPRG
ncbi:TauD/TfdA dioxygenase family protein [Paraburkholderia sp. RL18-085-BIA-A]|uniref:TauD/TfdA dioxygenase family protein n=1 Tax=Paraburkholderia sp. RL18-085-BIA-A TaxID=3031633 RepID=UPI0038BC352E